LTVPAGDSLIVYHWALQRYYSSPIFESVGDIADHLRDVEYDIPSYYYEGLTTAEAMAGLNAGSNPDVVGEAGSVVPYAVVTAENLTNGRTGTVTAQSDGSFNLWIRYTSAGDQIHVTATDGLDVTMTAQ
jgi:hypothetical protein